MTILLILLVCSFITISFCRYNHNKYDKVAKFSGKWNSTIFPNIIYSDNIIIREGNWEESSNLIYYNITNRDEIDLFLTNFNFSENGQWSCSCGGRVAIEFYNLNILIARLTVCGMSFKYNKWPGDGLLTESPHIYIYNTYFKKIYDNEDSNSTKYNTYLNRIWKLISLVTDKNGSFDRTEYDKILKDITKDNGEIDEDKYNQVLLKMNKGNINK